MEDANLADVETNIEIEAVVIRADGRRENLGIIASSKPATEPIVREK